MAEGLNALMMSSPITLDEVEAARLRLAGMVSVTPCSESIALSELTGSRVFCKLEYLQRTGSFKERGAVGFPPRSSPH